MKGWILLAISLLACACILALTGCQPVTAPDRPFLTACSDAGAFGLARCTPLVIAGQGLR